MGEHRTNTRAMYADSLPNIAGLGEMAAADMQMQVAPKPNVVLVPAERIRTVEGGKQQVLKPETEDEWADVPPDADVCVLGQLLPVSKCDVIATVFSIKGSERVAVAAMRFPLEKWRDAHSIVKSGH